MNPIWQSYFSDGGWFNHQLVNTFPLEMVPKIQVTFGGPPLFLFRGSPATWRKLISENLGDGCFVLGIIRFSKIPMEDCNTPLLRIPILHIGIFLLKESFDLFFLWLFTDSTLVNHRCSPPWVSRREPSFSSGFVSLSWIATEMEKNLAKPVDRNDTEQKQKKTWHRSFYACRIFVGRIFIPRFIQKSWQHPSQGWCQTFRP